MRKTIKSLVSEAKEYGATVARAEGRFSLFLGRDCIAWVVPHAGAWLAQTIRPDITGSKKGGKVECLDWALDHTIEGWGVGENRHS